MKYYPWMLAALGGWLISAPFLLGYTETSHALKNDVAVGALILVGAAFWGFVELRGRGGNGHEEVHAGSDSIPECRMRDSGRVG
jgi:hypothetical protein